MTESLAEGSKGEVWMLDTFGNVHSLVNACQQLGFKVNRITSASELQSAKVPPRFQSFADCRKCSFVVWAISVTACLP
jgi:S-adenosylmethionine hydrolase